MRRDSTKTQEGKLGTLCSCGHFDQWPPYVWAHSRDLIDFQCPECRAKHVIVNMRSTQTTPGRKRRERYEKR